MAQTTNAKTVAREVSRILGRTVNDKRVRAWVRDNIAAFDDDGYTSHQYTAAQHRAIVDGMTKSAKTARSRAAAQGRNAKPADKRPAKPAATPATPDAQA